jgi:transposase-like protein
MANAFPAESRRDVVAVARNRKTQLNQIANVFGISEATMHNWRKRANIEAGVRPGPTEAEAAELRELRKRNQLLGHENYFLRRGAAYPGARTLPKWPTNWSRFPPTGHPRH